MADIGGGFVCYISVLLGFIIFYIIALVESTEVSEISCGKVMWYTVCIGTGFGVLSIPVQIYKREQLQQQMEQLKNIQNSKNMESPFSATEMCFQCLITIGVLVNSSLLLSQVLNIDSECEAEIEEYNLFWIAAQMQAYMFLTIICLFGFLCCCCVCCLIGGTKYASIED
jgi:hypothetical protein